MRTYKILPKNNNIDFAGRLIADPTVNEAKTRCTFALIRNFGGEKAPVILNFTMFLKDALPKWMKKGAAVVAHAFFNPDVYTNKDGKKVYRHEIVVKTVEQAELKDKILPGINDIAFSGRVVNDPVINEAGTCAMFKLIRNFGGDKEPVVIDLTWLRRSSDPAFPEWLKKGVPVTAHAFVNPAVYTDKDGNEVKKTQFVVKKAEQAALIEKTYADNEPAPAEAEKEGVVDVDVDIQEI